MTPRTCCERGGKAIVSAEELNGHFQNAAPWPCAAGSALIGDNRCRRLAPWQRGRRTLRQQIGQAIKHEKLQDDAVHFGTPS